MRIDRTKDVVVENDLIVYVLHISFAHRCISLVQLVFAERKKRKQMGCERKGLFQTQSDMFRYDFGADPAAIGIFFCHILFGFLRIIAPHARPPHSASRNFDGRYSSC